MAFIVLYLVTNTCRQEIVRDKPKDAVPVSKEFHYWWQRKAAKRDYI